jgi:hypothetical protein
VPPLRDLAIPSTLVSVLLLLFRQPVYHVHVGHLSSTG